MEKFFNRVQLNSFLKRLSFGVNGALGAEFLKFILVCNKAWLAAIWKILFLVMRPWHFSIKKACFAGQFGGLN